MRARPVIAASVAFAAIAAMVAAGYLGTATESVVRASDDTSVDLNALRATGGRAEGLVAGQGADGIHIAYLKFHFAALPGGRLPAVAEVRLRKGAMPLPRLVELSTVPYTGWAEESLTAATAPRLGRVVGSVRPDPNAQTIAFDVTRLIRAAGTYAFAITVPPGYGLANLLSRDATRDQYQGPQLWLSADVVLGPRDAASPSGMASSSPSPSAAPSTSGSASASTSPSASPSATPSASDSASPSASPSATPSASDSMSPSPSGPASPDCAVGAKLVPTCGVLWGAAAGAFTSTPREQALRDFEARTGRNQAIYHAYHRGTAELFPTPAEIALARDSVSPRILFLNWKPMVASWASIAQGNPQVDDFLDKLASHLKASFTEPFFFTVHHEPENDVGETAGSGRTASDYRDMYRHVISRLRADGVTNLVSVMNYLAYVPLDVKPWFGDLYPGDDVVDWVAWDTYAYSNPGYGYGDFAEMVNRTSSARPTWPGFYDWAACQFPAKPLMLAEWGVWESKTNPTHKAYVYDTAGAEIQLFPRIKALLYFDSPDAGGRDSRVDSTPEALTAYQRLGQLPLFQLPLFADPVPSGSSTPSAAPTSDAGASSGAWGSLPAAASSHCINP